ncbi:hypothetical protein C8Q79DRAFT_1010549 [Trametes meyenii]|nr:hypothetical protein C8Q79DRAFT_1010549 [Trametes meyenii]
MFIVFAIICSVLAASIAAPYILIHSWSKLPRDVQDLLLGTPIRSRFQLPQCSDPNILHDTLTFQFPSPSHEHIPSSPHHWHSTHAAWLGFFSFRYSPDLTDDDSEDDLDDDSTTHFYEARSHYFATIPDGEDEEALELHEARHNYNMSIPEDEQAALWDGLDVLEQ